MFGALVLPRVPFVTCIPRAAPRRACGWAVPPVAACAAIRGRLTRSMGGPKGRLDAVGDVLWLVISWISMDFMGHFAIQFQFGSIWFMLI